MSLHFKSYQFFRQTSRGTTLKSVSSVVNSLLIGGALTYLYNQDKSISYANEILTEDTPSKNSISSYPKAPNFNSTWPCPNKSDLNSNLWKKPTVHLMCGMISSGKSTLSKEISSNENAPVFSPDEYIMHLYGRDFKVEDFQTVGDQVKEVIWRGAQEMIVRNNSSVILDFSLWYREDRDYWKERILSDSMNWFDHCEVKPWEVQPSSKKSTYTQNESSIEKKSRIGSKVSVESPAVAVQIHYIECPAEFCRERLVQRNSNVLKARQQELDNRIRAEQLHQQRSDDDVVDTTNGTNLVNPTSPSSFFKPCNEDALNFIIDLKVFDSWSSALQTPQTYENANVYQCKSLHRDNIA